MIARTTRVDLDHLRHMMKAVADHAGLGEAVSEIVVRHFLEGELRRKPTHGVAKFCFESQFFGERSGSPRVVRDLGGMVAVDGRREVGPVAAAFAVNLVVERVKEYGAAAVGMTNVQRHGVLGDWADQVAEQGFVGIVLNSSPPEATVPGVATPFVGVNPMAFAVPCGDDLFSADFSTTLAPMGNLFEARRGHGSLRRDSFVDAAGEVSNDPDLAEAAIVFGGHRGLAISMLLEIVSGALFGFPTVRAPGSRWETGYVYMALDPYRMNASFGLHVRDFVESAQGALAAGTARDLRLPGAVSRDHRERCLELGSIEVDEKVYTSLVSLAGGVPVPGRVPVATRKGALRGSW